MISIVAARHSYPEPAGFYINRPKGHANWTFLHFYTPMTVKINGKTIKTQPHACIIYKPGFKQFFSSNQPLIHDWIHFDVENEDFLNHYQLQANCIFYPQQHEFITRLTREIENERNESFYAKQELLSIKMQEFFIKLHRSIKGQVADRIPVALGSALKTLRENIFLSLDKTYSVSSLAKQVGLSESRFYAVYKSFFGISPTEDIIFAKIESAKNALLGSDLKISVIASELGYNDVTHFIRQFKKRTGKTPNEYRNS